LGEFRAPWPHLSGLIHKFVGGSLGDRRLCPTVPRLFAQDGHMTSHRTITGPRADPADPVDRGARPHRRTVTTPTPPVAPRNHTHDHKTDHPAQRHGRCTAQQDSPPQKGDLGSKTAVNPARRYTRTALRRSVPGQIARGATALARPRVTPTRTSTIAITRARTRVTRARVTAAQPPGACTPTNLRMGPLSHPCAGHSQVQPVSPGAAGFSRCRGSRWPLPSTTVPSPAPGGYPRPGPSGRCSVHSPCPRQPSPGCAAR
jgi:hypothetical protein